MIETLDGYPELDTLRAVKIDKGDFWANSERGIREGQIVKAFQVSSETLCGR